MRATRLTFFRVARSAAPAAPWLRPGADEVSGFLSAHVAGLRDRAVQDSAARASFADPSDLALVTALRDGDDTKFLAAARTLGERLLDQMNKVGGTRPGLFVCATLTDDADPPTLHATALKLQVVSAEGAVLQTLDSGEETLAAVTNVLDRPGELQKGLVYPDARPGSDAVVGDKAAQQEALYFLRAMGVTLEARDAQGPASIVNAVAGRAGRGVADLVARALPAAAPAAPAAVLADIRRTVPALTPQTADDVVRKLADAPRPVTNVDTAAPVKATMLAGGLKITGPADAVRLVTWDPDPQGGWRVTFPSDTEPTVTWR